jgi:NADH-quinone oxidoreductase subunit N
MTIYVAMTLGSFVVVLQMRDAAGHPIESIASLSGLSRTRPGMAAALAMFMFSLAGIPPLFGFYAKFAVFDAAVQAGLFPLAVAGIAASVIGAYYYLRIVKTMYFDAPEGEGYARDGGALEPALIGLAALAISPFGYLLIGPLQSAAGVAAGSLF